MSRPVVRVVGLGPGDADLMTRRAVSLIEAAPVVRLRTRVHPAAAGLAALASYDDLYESADSFEALYDAIVEDLVGLASSSPTQEVLYVVPGSPLVAESTVERLRARPEVTTICEPSVSVIDVACAAMGVDPMAAGVRVVDALGGDGAWRGSGPLLVLQAYAPAVLAVVADRLAPSSEVTVLHHLGLPDEVVEVRAARDLAAFDADHLTSLWVQEWRSPGAAVDDLVALERRLRRECPWDVVQTHGSLTRHLLEESYEVIDALETFARLEADGALTPSAVAHVREELGDLLFQVVFHAELGDEEGHFDLASIADAVREKNIARHPHVFGDAVARDAAEVASRWEELKVAEEGRASLLDGVAWQQPALSLYAKLARKAAALGGQSEDARSLLEAARAALATLEDGAPTSAADSLAHTAPAWGDALGLVVRAARVSGVDLEGVLRERAMRLRDEILAAESSEVARVDE